MTIKCSKAAHSFGPIVAWKFFPNTEGADFWRAKCQNAGCDAAFMQTIPEDVKPVIEGEPFRATKTTNVEHNRRPQGVRVDGQVGPLAEDGK